MPRLSQFDIRAHPQDKAPTCIVFPVRSASGAAGGGIWDNPDGGGADSSHRNGMSPGSSAASDGGSDSARGEGSAHSGVRRRPMATAACIITFPRRFVLCKIVSMPGR